MKSRNIMKLILAGTISFCMIVAFAGCGDSNKSADDETTEETVESVAAPSGEYNISEGLELVEEGDNVIVKGSGFELTMPNTGTWSYEANTETNDTLSIYYMPAEEADFGGNLVTIMAMDMDDTSYEEFPSYAIAGESSTLGKRFIALFPTDVQYDPEDETQSAEYTELLTHVQTIDVNSGSNPFVVTE